ncbi:methionyl-tRNA formyltransferase [Seinonella peptonophila]|nr:methionyl-tRNA formyltransferase [Seinonella peptonophila]
MGTPEFAVPALEMLLQEEYPLLGVVTQPDRKKGRKAQLTPPPVKIVAEKHHIPVFQPARLRDSEELEQICQLKPDLIVTAAYGQILPTTLLEVPPFRCINLHASLLPKYRGGAPIHWAIYHGEDKTGVTIMYMEEKLDAGDMLMQQSVPITTTTDVGDMYQKLSVLAADMLQELLPRLIKGEIEPVVQDHSIATYAPNIKREDEEIQWERTAKQIDYHIRAFCPWPGTYTYWREKRVKVWQAICLEQISTKIPGTVLGFSDEGIQIATGEGVLQLQELQVAGKKRMDVSQFLQGNHLEIGERFGLWKD